MMWRQLSHPNIFPFLGVCDHLFDKRPCMVSPWSYHGNVMEFLEKNPNHDRLKLLLDVATGLAYLHGPNRKLVHGDLKGANILIDDQMHACIADFGIGKFLHTPGTYPATTSLKGTMQWMAPEQLALGNDPSKARSPESDVYSFSYVCLEIYTGNVPWPDTAEFAVMEKVLNRQRPERPADIPIP
ncbi:kinase-like protein, partial [Gloeophyllum trabeum ATCC 11539]